MLSVILVHIIIISHHSGILAAALDVSPMPSHMIQNLSILLSPCSHPLSLQWSPFLYLCVNRQRIEAAGRKYSR